MCPISWVPVALNSVVFLVSSDFIKTEDCSKYEIVSRQEARVIAANRNALLPHPQLVDAIYRQATCKLAARPKNPANKATDHAHNLRNVDEANSCKDKTLIAGHYKDMVNHNGRVGLYGWYKKDGTRIQPFFAGHSLNYTDYSQGLRLVSTKAFKIVIKNGRTAYIPFTLSRIK